MTSSKNDPPRATTAGKGEPAGGWGSARSILETISATPPSARTLQVLTRLNKHGGVMCTSCAWAKPAKTRTLELCEAGAKATIWELDESRAGPDFFSDHSLTDLRGLHDHELEKAGRLTHPMRYDSGTDHYVPVSWDDAFAGIARELNAMDPSEAVFYASGHAGLEASFLYALFARAMGHQNLPQSSNMCHETTSVNLQTFIGTPVGTCTLEDFDHCDAIFFFGQNTGTNSPRFLRELEAAVKRGCRIVSFNPLRESGMMEFVDPQSPIDMLTGKGTRITERNYQVRPGGDVAVLAGLMKCVLAAEDAAPGEVLDHDFIADHTTGFEAAATAVREMGWDDIERHSGLDRAAIEEAGAIYLGARNTIGIYGMGLTQHVGGWLNLGMLCNLLLMRGNIGRKGAGISPVRGHSNVQGQRTVGVGEKSAHMPAGKLREIFGIDAPTADGLNAVHACEALLDGRAKAMILLGGNLVRALPDRERMEKAWGGFALTVYIGTKLNRSHLTPGRVSYLLPCLGRADEDVQETGPQTVTVEDSLSHIYGSTGIAEPPGPEVRSEPAIVAGIAKATLPMSDRLDWDGWIADYARIRDLIARTFPDDFGDFNARLDTPGGFYRGNPARERVWKTESGKAEFTAPETLSALGDTPAGDDVFTLVTLRSADQFNTTVYGFSDRQRGLEGDRNIVMMNRAEIDRMGLTDGQRVTAICAVDDGVDRRMEGLTLTPYDLPDGCVAGYFPELNALVPLGYHETRSQTPAYKGTPVRIVP